MNVVVYARCSTTHHRQDPEVQLGELRRFAAARGWTVLDEIVDHGYSGKTDARPGLKKLMSLVRGRQCDLVLVFKMDRLFRSLKHLVNVLDEFNSLGVKFVSVTDQIDLTTSAGRLLVGVLGALAQFEADLIRERVMAGLAHATAQGKQLGRRQEYDYAAIRSLKAEGMSYRAIQARLGCSMGTISTALGLPAQKSLPKRDTQASIKTSP
jgi:putative DNA-invertase from lambdoid prophage Rac